MSPFEPSAVQERTHPNAELPLDPDVLCGVLENGLKYYIRRNTRPEKRAEIRLVVEAGSILEDEDQRGLAHIVEHMAFNGSNNFGARALVKYFESIGARFGAHLNAQTSFDSTIYKLHVPTDDPTILEQSFLVLHDWASGLLFLPEEIERERKVGLEEWRQHRGAHARMREKLFPLLYHGSRYVDRLPIGTEDSLKTFSHESLKRFFRDWYRPDLMSVVVVGDIDPASIQNQIHEYFAALHNPSSSREREYETLPEHEGVFGLVMSDTELVHRSFCVLSKKNKKAQNTRSDLLEDLVSDIAFHAMNERLSFLGQQKNAPFLGAKVGMDDLNRNSCTDVFNAVLPVHNIKENIQRCCHEILRFQRFGITEGELKRAKKSHMAALEAAYQERNTTHSRVLASELVRHITEDELLLGLDFERDFALEHVSKISSAQVNAFLTQWLPMQNRVQYFITPDEEHPSNEEFDTWIKEAFSIHVEAPQEEDSEHVLLSTKPQPGHVVHKSNIPELDMEEWVLSNGVKVWIKDTDFQTDRILLSSCSSGGRNSINTEEYHDSKLTTGVVFRSGVGAHSFMDLQKLLSGASVRIIPALLPYSHGFDGVCTVNHLETLFQLHYLFCTEPRLDDDTFLREIEVSSSHFHNRLSDPNVQFQDAFLEMYWSNHPRIRPWTSERIALVSKETCKAQYDRLFRRASTHYVISGNIDIQNLEEWLGLYVASLPSPKAYDQQDWGLRNCIESKYRCIQAGQEPSARYRMRCFVEGDLSRIDRIHTTILGEYINLVLRRRLREELGAVYSVHASIKSMQHPEKGCQCTIEFACAPERVEELRTELQEILTLLPTKAFSGEDIANIVHQLERDFETSIKENQGWMAFLTTALSRQEDPRGVMQTPELLRSVTEESLSNYWTQIYDTSRQIELVMLPE